jgi:DNA-binding response OmpR family regulator
MLSGRPSPQSARRSPPNWAKLGVYSNSLQFEGVLLAEITILVFDDDESSQRALHSMLDSEGWRVRVVPLLRDAMNELAHGSWSMVIANLALTGIDGPEFTLLSELASAPPVQDGKSRVRVLFVVPELLAGQALPILEHGHLPYVMKPFHFHDFLQKVGDLLIESKALPKSIRTAKFGFEESDRRKKADRRAGKDRRGSTMFAPREDYYMTEEELAEWEKGEKEEQKKRKLTDRPI